jgi:hypothetical protein
MASHSSNREVNMKIIDAINEIDSLKPNGYEQTEKIRWLSRLDGIIKVEILDNHEGEEVYFDGYDENTDLEGELLVPAPYDEIYRHYLEMQINYANGEYDRYNNAREMYERAYSAFEKYYNRKHRPKSHRIKFF